MNKSPKPGIYICQYCKSIRSSVNDIELSMVTNILTIDGQSIELSPKECELLYVLLENPGIPIPTENIHRKMYGTWSTKIPPPDTIYVYVNHLRNKLSGTRLSIINQVGRGFYINIEGAE